MDADLRPVADFDWEGVARAYRRAVDVACSRDEVEREGYAGQGEDWGCKVVKEGYDFGRDKKSQPAFGVLENSVVILAEIEKGVVVCKAECIVRLRGGRPRRELPCRIQAMVLGAVKVVVVMAALIVVLVVVPVVRRAAHMFGMVLLAVALPPPHMAASRPLWRIDAQVRKRHPVQLNLPEPCQGLPAIAALLLNAREESLEDIGPAAQEDGVVLEEGLEGFAGHLLIQQKVFVVQG